MCVFLFQGVENAVCVLRNLSYQLYSEIHPSVQTRLEGPSRAEGSSKGEAIGCFTPNSKKAKDVRMKLLSNSCFLFQNLQLNLIFNFYFQRQNQDLSTFTEVSRQPKDMELLWHPSTVELYNQVLQRCENNSTTREAAAGALQNITAGEKRVRHLPHFISYVVLQLPRICEKLARNALASSPNILAWHLGV